MQKEINLKDKSGDWILKKTEGKFKNFLVPKVPQWMETYHLTYLTLLWSFCVILFFYLGAKNHYYLFLIPIFVVLQYISDLLDGAVGRHRNTGLVKWGYYADHFLDFIFLTSVILGYGVIIGFNIWIFILYTAVCGLMIHTHLLVSANKNFYISFLKIGPTEGRLIFIIVHLVVVFIGINILDILLPYIVFVLILALLIIFFNGQKLLWKEDINNKNNL